MKYEFTLQIPNAPNSRAAWYQVRNLAREGRLAEFVTAVNEISEQPWRDALKPKRPRKH